MQTDSPENNLLEEDINYLEKLAFRRKNLLTNCFTRLHAIRCDPQFAEHVEILDTLRKLLRKAYSRYSSDFKTVADHVCEEIKAGRPLHPAVPAALKIYASIPSDDAEEIVIACEWNQSEGNYDDFLTDKGKDKAKAAEEELAGNAEAQADLEAFFQRHPHMAKKRGVITRTLMLERNRKPDNFKFEPTPEGLAQLELNALAAKHVLWGLEKGKMLRQRLTVTISDLSVDISIPRGQSVDFQRDLNWKAILEYIRLSGAERQGEKLRVTQTEARVRNKKMYLLHEQGKADGRKGQELQSWVEEELDLLPMDEANYGRCVRLGKKIVEAERQVSKDESKK